MAIQDMKPVTTLDVKELSCPMPLIHTKRALEKINPGDILEVLCTYPDSGINVPGWCERSGHILLGETKDSDCMRLYIKKQ